MTSQSAGGPFELLDPSVDGAIEDGGPPRMRGVDGRPTSRWRRSLAWSATSAPVALLLLAGIACGPRGINLLSADALSSLDPVVPVALAALGVLVGLGIGDRRADDRRLSAAAFLASAVTMIVVSAGTGLLALAATSSVAAPPWTLFLAAGICAATSLTLPISNPLEPRAAVTRVIELGVLLPIVAGGLLLAWLRSGSPLEAGLLALQVSAITIALGTAGWLLLARVTSETDQRVFAISALLLVGGVADALALSALLCGLVAGVFWRYAGGTPRDTIRRDVLFVQHPLLVLVLLVAGARAELSSASLALGAGYLAMRVLGTVAGSAVAKRVAGPRVPPDLGLHLLPPGVFGVAFALNAAAVVGDAAAVLITAVVIGTIGSELVALLVPPRSVTE
jgi:hypothetical protein